MQKPWFMFVVLIASLRTMATTPDAAYPASAKARDERAVALCESVVAYPAKRHAECCKNEWFAGPARNQDECVRLLSLSLQSGALTLEMSEVVACRTALEKKLAGCDWLPKRFAILPSECQNVLKGKVGKGARCRSRLECAGGHFCLGMLPFEVSLPNGSRTTQRSFGTCNDPLPDGAECNILIDDLEIALRFGELSHSRDLARGPCQHSCNYTGSLQRCQPGKAAGADCFIDAACGDGLQCFHQKCAKGPEPKPGDACEKTHCSEKLQCINGKCAEPPSYPCLVPVEPAASKPQPKPR